MRTINRGTRCWLTVSDDNLNKMTQEIIIHDFFYIPGISYVHKLASFHAAAGGAHFCCYIFEAIVILKGFVCSTEKYPTCVLKCAEYTHTPVWLGGCRSQLSTRGKAKKAKKELLHTLLFHKVTPPSLTCFLSQAAVTGTPTRLRKN